MSLTAPSEKQVWGRYEKKGVGRGRDSDIKLWRSL